MRVDSVWFPVPVSALFGAWALEPLPLEPGRGSRREFEVPVHGFGFSWGETLEPRVRIQISCPGLARDAVPKVMAAVSALIAAWAPEPPATA